LLPLSLRPRNDNCPFLAVINQLAAPSMKEPDKFLLGFVLLLGLTALALIVLAMPLIEISPLHSKSCSWFISGQKSAAG